MAGAAGTRRARPSSAGGTGSGSGRTRVTGPAAGSPGPAGTRLDERYGRRPSSTRRRRAAVGAVVALAVAALAWVVWAGTGLAQRDRVMHQVVGFSPPTATGVSLVFQVTKDPAATARCDVRALAADFTTVGWRTVDLGPAEGEVVQREVEIRTQQPAVSAEVMGCELLGAP